MTTPPSPPPVAPARTPSTRGERRDGVVMLPVDRVRCSAHGICAQILPGRVELDEWGYPIVIDARVTPDEAKQAIAHCPALALYRAER